MQTRNSQDQFRAHFSSVGGQPLLKLLLLIDRKERVFQTQFPDDLYHTTERIRTQYSCPALLAHFRAGCYLLGYEWAERGIPGSKCQGP